MSDPGKHYELSLLAEPQRFAVVRRIIQAHLRHWDLPELVDPALVGVTELLGNVHRHVGRGQECRLRMAACGGCVRFEVHDPSPALPRLLQPGAEDLGGRGLALVAALSKEWGAEAEAGGKVVWFSLQTDLVPATPRRGAGTRSGGGAAGGAATRQGVGWTSAGVLAVSRS